MIYEVETAMGLLVIQASRPAIAIKKAMAIQEGSVKQDPVATIVATSPNDYGYDPKEMVIK